MLITKKGKVFSKFLGIFSSKRSRVFIIASFFVFCGVFAVFSPTFAGITAKVVLGLVGQIAMLWVWLMGKLIALTTYILIAIANYNNFSNSEAITTGWVIIRDICNMFFVIIFLVIAFGTILGVGNYHYSKTLPRLLLMAILINFSKTIAGLVIDFGQVIMMTFVNGFSTAAGGNFLEVLQLQHLTEIRATPDESTIDHWDAVGGLILACVVATVSVIVMTIMAMVLVMRVVMLWFLVVLSPLAFFSAAVPSSSISGYYNTWWKKFTAEVTVGPILAFFIWLSLAVVSSVGAEGDEIAKGATIEEGAQIAIGETGTESVSAMSVGIGDESVMLKYLIGIGMLVGGLIMAKETGAAGSGIAGSGVSWMKSKSVGAAKWIGKRSAKGVYSGAYNTAESRTRETREKAYSGMVSVPLVSSFATKRLSKIRGKRQEESAEAGKVTSKLKETDMIKRYNYLTKKGKVLRSEKENAQLSQLQDGIVKRGTFKSDLSGEEKKLYQSALAGMTKRAEATDDPDIFKKVKQYKQTRPDLLEEKDMQTILEDMSALDIVKEVSIKAFKPKTKDGKPSQFLSQLSKNEDIWNSVYKTAGAGKKKAMDEFKKEGEITKENFKKMKPQQIETALKNDTLKVDAIEVNNLKADNGALAGQIAQHGSSELKEAMQSKFGKGYSSALSSNMEKRGRENPVGPGYNATASSISKEMLRSGSSLKTAYNAGKDGSISGRDELEFGKAVDERLGGDALNMLNIKPEELRGRIKEIVNNATYDPVSIRKLANNAATSDQKEVFEKILQGVYEKSGNIADSDMMDYIEGSSRLRKHIPKELKIATRRKASQVRASEASKQAEAEREKIREEQRERAAARAEHREKWQARKAKAKVVKKKRIRSAVPGGAGQKRQRLAREAAESGRAVRTQRAKASKARSVVEKAIKEGSLEDETKKDAE